MIRRSRFIENVSAGDRQECGRVSLIEGVHGGISMARTPETVKAERADDDHYYTVVSSTMVYYRWVVSGRKMKSGMKSCSLL
jgi:hypothetical protein